MLVICDILLHSGSLGYASGTNPFAHDLTTLNFTPHLLIKTKEISAVSFSDPLE